MNEIALFEGAAGYALAGLAGVTRADLDRPTPCSRWDLRALLVHLADSADALAGLLTTGALSCPGDPPRPGPDPVTTARDRIGHLLDALRSTSADSLCTVADQPIWAGTAAGVGAIELAAHGWDVSVACRRDRPVPAGLATPLLRLSARMITDAARHPEFAPAVPVAPDATAGDRLIGFLGRRPR